jgi:hypothetical protein
MKNVLALLLLSLALSITKAQQVNPQDAVITVEQAKTGFYTQDGNLYVNASPADLRRFKTAGQVRYNDFGAKGDGKTDDQDAIAATHAFANQYGLKVKADDRSTYYIGGKARVAVIRTDTDFGKASFVIDDTRVETRDAPIFLVASTLEPFKLTTLSSLRKGQRKIDASLPAPCLVTVVDTRVKHYIRFGLNQNNGSSKTDIFLVDKAGNVDMNTPIIWDFDQITEVTARPIDQKPLKITGGRFTTIANRAESKYTYYNRNLTIKRSNVTVDGLEHRITGEGDQGAPYGGFINIADCSHVTVKNTVLTGHKTYSTIGAAGKPVTMGTYDISANRALNVSFVNCGQTNDINDTAFWGIMSSNFCKNLLYDRCTLSRFDAHQGVANATIRNSTLGHMGINAIGTGTLLVENSTILGRNIVNLRPDYGSTWQGDLIIRNCVFIPANGKPLSASLIGGSNTGQHDFGYVCYMPARITIENLQIEDAGNPPGYAGPAIFANVNPEMADATYQQKFPYQLPAEVVLKNVTTSSGKPLRVSDNTFVFKDVKITAR